MNDTAWSPKEKQIARRVFERAALTEERELLERFKTKAAVLENLEGLWALQNEYRDLEHEYQKKYDYRYSQLIFVFGRLVREGRVSIDELTGLSSERLLGIERLATMSI